MSRFWNGGTYSVSKWCSIKSKDLTSKLGKPDGLSGVDEKRAELRERVSNKLRGFISETKAKHKDELKPLQDERKRLVEAQRDERAFLVKQQQRRKQQEESARGTRLRSGLSGLIDKITGKAREIRDQNAQEAYSCARRDQRERDQLILSHLEERQPLQGKFEALKSRHRSERQDLAREVHSVISGRQRFAPSLESAPRLSPSRPSSRSQRHGHRGLSHRRPR